MRSKDKIETIILIFLMKNFQNGGFSLLRKKLV